MHPASAQAQRLVVAQRSKVEGDEHLTETARRETVEETGSEVALGPMLPGQRYRVEGRLKTVGTGSARPGQAVRDSSRIARSIRSSGSRQAGQRPG